MNIYIIILHYGKLETTQSCITSLLQHDNHFEKVILVNNDEKVNLAAADFTRTSNKIHIINNKKNLGFAAGVNIGIKYALAQKAEYIFLLNNDTVIEKDFLKKLIAVAQKDKHIGIIGPVLTFQKNSKTYYDFGGDVNLLIGRTSHHNVDVLPSYESIPQEVTYISGCCMLIKREVFKEVGLFDEKFFLYYEDVDFCLRAKEKGFLSYVVPSAVIYHELSKAAGRISPFSVYYQTKSGVIFGKKYCKMRLLNLAFLFAQSCLFLIKDSKSGFGAFKGFYDGFKN